MAASEEVGNSSSEIVGRHSREVEAGEVRYRYVHPRPYAVGIILCSLLRICEDFIRGLNGLEFGRGVLIWISIWMVLKCYG